MEEWRDIPDYEGKYQISNLGRVKSINFHRGNKEKILTTFLDGRGYPTTFLYKDGKRKTFRIHRIIAKIFIPNPNNLPQVNHKNEDKTCNVIDLNNLYGEMTNLEWCTNKYNCRYSKSKKINQYDLEGNFIKMWGSAIEVEENLGIKKTNLCNCLTKRSKTAGGYLWRFVNEDN